MNYPSAIAIVLDQAIIDFQNCNFYLWFCKSDFAVARCDADELLRRGGDAETNRGAVLSGAGLEIKGELLRMTRKGKELNHFLAHYYNCFWSYLDW
jgi:hypothetical protein